MPNCRICGKEVVLVLDLGYQPLANALLDKQDQQEQRYPLKFYFCNDCKYGMVPDMSSGNIFDDTYPYYSSINTSYVKQCHEWAFDYKNKYRPGSVLEIGCNDGYMLQNFSDIKAIGVEPSIGPCEVARKKGLNVINTFFWTEPIKEGPFDLIIANNVVAHTPRLSEMAKGIANNLSDKGMAVIEFPALDNLIKHSQYDTIYHEHFSYFTLYSLVKLFQKFDLHLNKYDEIPSHGGSIRAYFSKKLTFGVGIPYDAFTLESFSEKVRCEKDVSLSKMIYQRGHRNKLALFGAAAKGNTFLNYLGVSYDFFEFCVDETSYKIGKFLPGSRIPIVGIEKLQQFKPDYIWILPWNFRKEIEEKCSFVREWGCSFETKGF